VAESTSNAPDPAMPTEMDALSRAAFNAAPDLLVITNFDGTVVEINPRALEVLGCSREELIGMHPTQLLWDADPSRFEHELKSLQDGNPCRGEWQVRRKDGSAAWTWRVSV
jgi:PAS domain S-box-containing protein